MGIADDVILELESNKYKRESGELIAIPWTLPRLSNVLPGISKGRYVICSANQKVGKTQMTDFLFLYQPLEWLFRNQDSDINIKIHYFSLEMSKKAKIRAAICYKLHKEFNIIISPEKLQSLFKGYILDDKTLKIIKSEKMQKWLQFIEEHVEFYDEIRNPYGIYSTIKAYALKNGSFTKKTIDWTNDFGEVTQKEVNDKYIPNHPNEYVIVITDHISLLSPEKGDSLHQAMSKFSSEYCLSMRDKFNYIPVVVQQQSAASEAQQFNKDGKTIIDKLKPSADCLADNKLTARDCDLLLGLFWPQRYNIKEYHNWNLNIIGRYHRELLILANRHGVSSASIDLYMNGATNYFGELPKEPTNEIYEYIDAARQKEI